jgi:hypothetical protein
MSTRNGCHEKTEQIMTDTQAYIERKPGDLITAQDWNAVQQMIKDDIAGQISDAVDGITSVPNAEDASKLEGKTSDELAQQVLDYVLRQLPKRTGYLSVFRNLQLGEESVIEHKLSACPLVDVYQLEYFEVVASEDDNVFKTLTTFFLHHTSERTIRFREEGAGGTPESIDIEPPDGHAYRIPFKVMLELYGVEAPEDSNLGDIEAEFWSAFNSAPNDRFDDDQIYHSPWFDRCCGEKRTVRSLARDWDDIWFQVRPRKTINYDVEFAEGDVRPAPTQVQVAQFDLDTIGLTLLGNPDVRPYPGQDGNSRPDHLKVMVLMKV